MVVLHDRPAFLKQKFIFFEVLLSGISTVNHPALLGKVARNAGRFVDPARLVYRRILFDLDQIMFGSGE